MPALEAYRKALEAVGPIPRELGHVLEILFERFEPIWLEANQKFDLSLSSREGSALRLSVNDFGEKPDFDAKILRIFDLFAPDFDRDAARRMLEASLPLKPLHQTTFGLDWAQGAARPRLKIYLEELRHRYSKEARAALLDRVCRAAGIGAASLLAGEDLAAFCLDFFPDAGIRVKTYAYRPPGEPRTVAGGGFEPFLRALSKEPRCFYYRTLRFGAAGGLESEKVYKVYEAQQIEDVEPGLSEIGDALSQAGSWSAAELMGRLASVAGSHGGRLYPVLCAMDRPVSGAPRVDAYLSVR